MPTYTSNTTFTVTVTVTVTGTYDISAFGAQGGGSSGGGLTFTGGFGAEAGGTFNLVVGV